MIKGLSRFCRADFADLMTARILHKIPVRAGDGVESISGVRASMKFLPPEDEIRAQLRELTSKTRRLRTDLQGLINDRGHSSAFSRDRRLHAKANTSLLTGNFRTRLSQSINGGTSTLIDVSDKFTKVVPITELGLGLAWQTDRIYVSVGYEIANFFNMVDSVDFVDGSSFGKIQHRQSDLSYDGLAVSVGLFF